MLPWCTFDHFNSVHVSSSGLFPRPKCKAAISNSHHHVPLCSLECCPPPLVPRGGGASGSIPAGKPPPRRSATFWKAHCASWIINGGKEGVPGWGVWRLKLTLQVCRFCLYVSQEMAKILFQVFFIYVNHMRYVIFNNPCFEVNAAAEISQTKAQDVICEQENFPFHAEKSVFHNFQLWCKIW